MHLLHEAIVARFGRQATFRVSNPTALRLHDHSSGLEVQLPPCIPAGSCAILVQLLVVRLRLAQLSHLLIPPPSTTMVGSISIKRILVLAAGIVVLASASCPYNVGNEGLKQPSPEHRLEPRYHTDSNFGRCPRKRLSKYAGGGSRSWDWWPCELSLEVLRQNGKESNPMGADFIYANEFAKLDCKLNR